MKSFISLERTPYIKRPFFKIAIMLFTLTWVWLYMTAIDKTDWWIENILVFGFFFLIFFAQRKYVFSNTSLVFLFLFLALHIYGAQGAYTQNQFGEWLQAELQLSRNPYDRIVHFSFGFLLAYPLIEYLTSLRMYDKHLIFNVNMAILSLATVFELLEWGVASVTDAATGQTYVATQGDPWDAQKDIFLALIGSMLFSIFYNMFFSAKSILLKSAQVEVP